MSDEALCLLPTQRNYFDNRSPSSFEPVTGLHERFCSFVACPAVGPSRTGVWRRRIDLAGDDNLARLTQTEIDCNQHLRHRARKMRKRWPKSVDCSLGAIFELFVVPTTNFSPTNGFFDPATFRSRRRFFQANRLYSLDSLIKFAILVGCGQ